MRQGSAHARDSPRCWESSGHGQQIATRFARESSHSSGSSGACDAGVPSEAKHE